MADGGVAKKGDVNFLVRGIRKSWQKRFCVLHRQSPDSHPYMELFENQNMWVDKKKPDKKLDLNNVKGIYKSIQVTNKGQECQITIHSKSGKHMLGFSSEDEVNDWEFWFNQIVILCPDKSEEGSGSSAVDQDSEVVTENLMYEKTESAKQYDVVVEESPFTRLNELAGKQRLLVGVADLALENPKTRRLVTWPFSCIRRYGMTKKKEFLFECGRHCQTGEGIVHCQSEVWKEIHALVLRQAHKSSRSGHRQVPIEPVQDNGHSAESDELRHSGRREEKLHTPTQDKPVDMEISSPEPTLITNLRTHHPGVKNLPHLISLKDPDSDTSKSPTKLHKDMRFSAKTEQSKGNMQDIQRAVSIDSEAASRARHRAPAEYEFVKGLDKVLHKQVNNAETPAPKAESIKAHRKSRDEKREKEETRKHKEDKKEDSGKSHVFGGIFSKKKSKDRQKAPEPTPNVPVQQDTDLYEEADIVKSAPIKQPPVPTEIIYDEAVTGDKPLSIPSNEYSTPYIKKPTPPATQMYEDVKDMRTNAWENYGRTENEEIHEENYMNIKAARDQKDKQQDLPPLPARGYCDEDEEDQTYDRIHLKQGQRGYKTSAARENLYGTAGAKPVSQNIYGTASGRLEDVQTYEMAPEPDYSTGGEEEDEEEDHYNTCGGVDPSEGYEEQATKPARIETPPPESLYDEVN